MLWTILVILLVLWLLGLVVAFPLALIVISYAVKTVPGLLGLEYAQTFADNAQIFADATKTTLLLTVTSGILGIILGTVTGIAKLSGFPPFRWIASFYVWVFRGTPLIVQILFAFNPDRLSRVLLKRSLTTHNRREPKIAVPIEKIHQHLFVISSQTNNSLRILLTKFHGV